MLTVTLIIPTKNREVDLSKAVTSVLHQTRKPDEIIIVDAGTDSFLKDKLENQINGKLKFKYINSAAGLPIQRNIGIKASSCDIISFIDDDSIIEINYIHEIVSAFENQENEKVAAISSRITNFPSIGKLNRLYFRFFGLSEPGDGGLKLSGFLKSPYHINHCMKTDFLQGCCMSFRRIAFEQIRFDENLPGWATMEDVDIARQIKAIDGTILYLPSAQQEHYPSADERLDHYAIAQMIVRNHYYLFTKHCHGSLFQKISFVWSLIGLSLLPIKRGGMTALRGYISGICRVMLGKSIKFDSQKNDGGLFVTENKEAV